MILLVGYGYWGRNLARNFSKELAAVCDSRPDALDQAAALYPDAKTYNDFDQALQHPGLKAVLIATKASSHFELASQAIKHGLDVWVEKPVCHTLEQVKLLADLAAANDRIVFVDHTFCYNPAVEKIRSIDIGKPIYYDSLRIGLGLFQGDVDALLDLSIHDLSIIDYLYPDLELQDRHIVKHHHITDNQANQVVINLMFTNGFTATINCNWVSPVKKRHIIITGDKNSIIYDDIDVDKIKIYNTGVINTDYNANQLGDMLVPKIGTQEALSVARQHFLQCIDSRQQPRTSIQRAQKIMEWVL